MDTRQTRDLGNMGKAGVVLGTRAGGVDEVDVLGHDLGRRVLTRGGQGKWLTIRWLWCLCQGKTEELGRLGRSLKGSGCRELIRLTAWLLLLWRSVKRKVCRSRVRPAVL